MDKPNSPIVYAYSDRNYPGLLKIGFTMKDVESRVAAQYPIKTPFGKPWKIELAICSIRDDGSFYRDSDIHHRLSMAGHANEGGEWYRCNKDDVLRACNEEKSGNPFVLDRQLTGRILYKINIMEALSNAGYSSTRLRREKLLGESYMTQLRRGEMVSWAAFGTVCGLLDCQPGDLIEYVKDTPAE